MSHRSMLATLSLVLALAATLAHAQLRTPSTERILDPVEESHDRFHAASVPGDEFWEDRFALSGSTGEIKTMVRRGNYLYVGGAFRSLAGLPTSGVARLDLRTGTWSALGRGLWSRPSAVFEVSAMTFDANGDLYVTGKFDSAGSIAAKDMARWDGSTWHLVGGPEHSPLGENVAHRETNEESQITSIAAHGTRVYIGGRFNNYAWSKSNTVSYYDKATGVVLPLGMRLRGTVNSMTLTPSGSLYVSGYGLTIDGQQGNVLMLRDTSWTIVESNATAAGIVQADGETIYATIMDAEKPNVWRVKKWNGSTWTLVADDIGGDVKALAISGSDIYVGGTFATTGGVEVNSIAKWNGSHWDQFANGIRARSSSNPTLYPGAINAIDIDGSTLRVAGTFTHADVVRADNIAQWDGTAWSPLSAQVRIPRYAVSILQNYLVHVGGAGLTPGIESGFTYSAPLMLYNIGDQWYNGGVGLTSQSIDTVYALTSDGQRMYVGGRFSSVGSGISGSGLITASNIAKISNYTWSVLQMGGNQGVDGTVYAIAIDGTDIYVGGRFTSAGGVAVSNVARWNGGRWYALGEGVDGPVRAIAVAPGSRGVYVGGEFANAGSTSASNLAFWNGSAWGGVGEGTNGVVRALAIGAEDPTTEDVVLYVGGSFTSAGASGIGNLASWNGEGWAEVGGVVDGAVHALFARGSELIAGGAFTLADEIPVNHIGRFDGTRWRGFGSGTDGTVNAIHVFYNYLYVAGEFTAAGGKASAGFNRWSNLSLAVRENETISATSIEAIPNPSNGSTRIAFNTERPGMVRIEIVDSHGRVVATPLVESTPAGHHSVQWNAGDLPNGVYLCRATSPTAVATTKVTLIR